MKKVTWNLITLLMVIVLYAITFYEKIVLETEPGNFMVMTIIVLTIMVYNKSEK